VHTSRQFATTVQALGVLLQKVNAMYLPNTVAAGQSAMDGDNLDRVTELRLSPVQNSLS
jgi:hypothetical protein